MKRGYWILIALFGVATATAVTMRDAPAPAVFVPEHPDANMVVRLEVDHAPCVGETALLRVVLHRHDDRFSREMGVADQALEFNVTMSTHFGSHVAATPEWQRVVVQPNGTSTIEIQVSPLSEGIHSFTVNAVTPAFGGSGREGVFAIQGHRCEFTEDDPPQWARTYRAEPVPSSGPGRP